MPCIVFWQIASKVEQLGLTSIPDKVQLMREAMIILTFSQRWCHWIRELVPEPILHITRKRKKEQGKSEGFDSCDRPSNLTQIGFKSSIFQPMWPLNLMNDIKKAIGHFFYTTSSFVHHFKTIGEFKLELVRKRSIRVKIDKFFVSRDLEIWWMTLKNNRALLLYYVKPCASFQSHGLIEIGVT